MQVSRALIFMIFLTTSSDFEIKVSRKGWGKADAGDIEKVLKSAAKQLLHYFPDKDLKPIVVEHSSKGPRTLFKRGPRKEIHIQLKVTDTHWAQFAFQFSHELGHVLCNYREGKNPNQWFEEALCETVSLFCLRSMSKAWERTPPFPGWKTYASSLKTYAVKRIDGFKLPAQTTLVTWYQKNETLLRQNPHLREKNGAIATALLPLFEKHPQHWQAISYLNTKKSTRTQSFKNYLQTWYRQSPQKHKNFIIQIGRLFGIPLQG